MNPLSLFTYYRRHKRRTLLMLALISLTTLGVCVMVRLLDSVVEHATTAEGYLSQLSLVTAIGSSLEPEVVSQIRAHPDVAQAIPEKSLWISLPPLESSFRVFGVSEANVQLLMDTCDVRLKEGRLLRPRTNEILLSEEVARALGLRIGDQIGRSIHERYYRDIPTELVLVGILEGDPSAALRTGPAAALPSTELGTGRTGPPAASGPSVRLGIVSYEYLDNHELYASRLSSLIVIAQQGRKTEVDRFLEGSISSPRADVWTFRQMSELLAQASQAVHLIFGVVDCLVAVVIALIVGTINRIAMIQRIQECGLLNAIGHSRKQLVRRLTLQMATVAGVSWVVGLALSWLLFAWLKSNVYAPRGMELNLANLTPVWFAVPIPLTAIAFVTISTMRTFARFDAVDIIERDKLSTELRDRGRAAKASRGPRSSAKPLSSWTFYLRHRRRGLALAVTMALMILGVAFPAFLFAPMIDANQLFYEYLSYVSEVSPRMGGSVDPGVTAQLGIHPDVARVIPAIRLGLMIEVPPVNRTTTGIHGASEDDIQYLVNLYGMQLEEGRYPRPRSNEIVLSKAIAMNRGLRVGDKVGRPVYGDDIDIPTEMVVVGILSRFPRDPNENDLWVGFASSEYLRSHEFYSSRPVSLFVVPTEGHKSELDGWLEEDIASEQTRVRTYDTLMSGLREDTWILLLAFAVVESVIAIVAAIALAVLSYTFFAQRREEFGILHAMGHSRRWLVLRTVGEAVSVVAVAWLIGAVVCAAGMVYMQANVYAPRGLTLDFFNPSPWLFTLPMPLAVVAVSGGLVAWMLARLDSVSIIERR